MNDNSYEISNLFPENSLNNISSIANKEEDKKGKIPIPKSLIREITKDSSRKLLIRHIPRRNE